MASVISQSDRIIHYPLNFHLRKSSILSRGVLNLLNRIRNSFNLVLLLIMVIPAVAENATVDIAAFGRLSANGKTQKAFDDLRAIEDNKIPYTQLHLKYFALGYWAFNLKKWSESRDLLENAMKYGRINAAHIYYLIGHSFKEEGKYDKAQEYFNRALDHKPPQNIIFQSRFELSEIAILNNSISKARSHLTYLEKRWRGTPNYPEIVWRMIGVELKENRKHLACRWARVMYSKQPTHPLVASWGVNLQENKFGVQQLGCVASQKDIRERMRRLNLSGYSDQARKEIEQLKSSATARDAQTYDMLLARHLESQGFPSEALKILSQHYESSKRNYNFLNLFAKVAARASEYSTAIGAYFSAYKLSPNSKNGKEALFTAAFLSYQTQDYDGAYRKFTELIKKYPGSGLARDSRWHLAWLKYLKTDYPGAEKSFRALLNEKYYARRRRVVRPFLNERTKYWLAMSLLKQQKFEEARVVFEPLANDKQLGFYSFAAQNRLKQLPAQDVPRKVAGSNNDAQFVGPAPANGEIEDAKALPNTLFSTGADEKADSESEDSEENLNTFSDEDSVEAEAPTEDSGPKFEASAEESETEAEKPETEAVTAFKNPQLRDRFQSASNLMAIGLNDWAKWELFEIERRTSNKTYLKMLMDAYTKIGSYNRAAYISEVHFSRERYKEGLKEGKQIWTYAYPRAYESFVANYAGKYGVPDALVYAIMRAESQFNQEALSPVGARGLMQIMPYTAQQLTKLLGEPSITEKDLHSAEVNLRLGSRYLSRLQKKFQSQIPLVAAGYNAGPHRVYTWLASFGRLEMDEFIEHVPFVETRNYMKKVVRNFALYQNLYNSKSNSLAWLTSPVVFDPTQTHTARENWDIID